MASFFAAGLRCPPGTAAVWANSDTDVWVAGEQGHVVHFDDRL
jgi:hypothetical protein